MTVRFWNNTPFDPAVMQLHGLSIKNNTDTPIGRFGTGWKHAMSTLIRMGCDINICTTLDGHRKLWEVTTRTRIIQGTSHEQVVLVDPATDDTIDMPFTLNMGVDWQPWQAYRELYANALDEKGGVSVDPVAAMTVILVDGIDKVHEERDKFLLTGTETIHETVNGVHRINRPGIFYQDMLVYQNSTREWLCGYHLPISFPIQLTEDRFIKNLWEARSELHDAILGSKDKGFLKTLFTTEDLAELELLHMSSAGLSKEAEFTLKENKTNLNTLAHWMFENITMKDKPTAVYDEITPSFFQADMLRDAIALINESDLGMTIPAEHGIKVSKDLGRHVMGLYSQRHDEVWLAVAAFDNGLPYLASTVYEEWAHKTLSLVDCTREMQDHLFKKLFYYVTKEHQCRKQ